MGKPAATDRPRLTPLSHSFTLDIILGFQHQTEADRFLENFRERLEKFGLELHPEKTRRIEFGRFAERNRERRGEGKPEASRLLGTNLPQHFDDMDYTTKWIVSGLS